MSIDAQQDKLGHGDRFAVKIINRSDGEDGQTHWMNVSADQKNRILDILRENDPYYTLTADDVGKSTLHAFGRVVPIVEVIGRVQRGDVGKRVYRRADDGHVSVENNDQRDGRLTRAAVARKPDQDSERGVRV